MLQTFTRTFLLQQYSIIRNLSVFLQQTYTPVSLYLQFNGTEMADARYCVEYAKTGRSGCKKCKLSIEKGVGRIGKISSNPFSDDGGEMKVWYHIRCMFETLKVSLIFLSFQSDLYSLDKDC